MADWPVPLGLEPMEAEPVAQLPDGPGWAFEPKYDGFRCIAFRDRAEVVLQSRRQKPLARFFPEIAEGLCKLGAERFVLDGELVIPAAGFDSLQMRLHPAASRIARLSRETPARLIAFDLLADTDSRSLLAMPFAQRRAALERLFAQTGETEILHLARQVRSRESALGWTSEIGHGLDGIVAKRLDLPYQPGRRTMLKYKIWHTVDCVVGGAYLKAGTDRIEYLLLGVYDRHGRLNYVGRCTPDGAETERRVRPLLGRGGFTGEAPGGPSRWSSRERHPIPAEPCLVVEASADHITAGKFRHGSRLVRWRDDKDPHACTDAQLIQTAEANNRSGR